MLQTKKITKKQARALNDLEDRLNMYDAEIDILMRKKDMNRKLMVAEIGRIAGVDARTVYTAYSRKKRTITWG